MKKFTLLLAAAVLAALVLTPGIAFANFKIHGGYTDDTDACAGCHRAHTSVSSITWTDKSGATNTEHSSLLVSNATQIYEFCYACHGNDVQGAETNVEGGVYKGTLYGDQNEDLNGGFFGDTNHMGAVKTSDHIISGGWGAYGGGQAGDELVGATGDIIGQQLGAGNTITMTCASCHDPHGSSNYRLLADRVNGNTRGGYGVGDVPEPWVISNEAGYPAGGWQKHEMGAAQVAAYTPDYTTERYAKAPGGDVNKGMSGWCAGCHNTYMQTGTPHGAESLYDAGDGWGLGSRHRHPMNIDLSTGYGANRQLAAELTPVDQIPLPLAHDNAGTGDGDITPTQSDWIDCMTCHVAHGSSAIMTGYANVADATNIEADSGALKNGSGGVQPTGDSALLRRNNRGVCETCHNK